MADIKTNREIFPRQTYSGINVSYFKVANDLINCIQIEHPASGSLEIATSIDYINQAYATKLWTKVPLKKIGDTTFSNIITFTTAEPDIIKFSCMPYAFLRVTLTASGGTYWAIYNAPTRQAEL